MDYKLPQNELREQLQSLLRAGVKQFEIVKGSKVRQSTVSRFLSGETKNIRHDAYLNLANYLLRLQLDERFSPSVVGLSTKKDEEMSSKEFWELLHRAMIKSAIIVFILLLMGILWIG